MNALKITWIRKLIKTKHKWKIIIEIVNEKVLLLNKLGNKLCMEENCNPFWYDVLKAYEILGDKIRLDCAEEILSEPLFCNNNILVEDKTIYFPDWIEKGAYIIGSLLNNNGNFFKFSSVCLQI